MDFQVDKLELYIGAFEAEDTKYESYQKLEVLVEDENDNAPQFSKSLYTATVREETFPPVSLLTVVATDADGPLNNQLRYQLKDTETTKLHGSNIGDLFDINPDTGEVNTVAKLDREVQSEYLLAVEAVNVGAGGKVLSGSTLIRVIVEDINDNPPRFTRILAINITENSPPGTEVATVETADKDIGVNANVTYEFTENPGGHFVIDALTGSIRVVGNLDREEQDEYLLKVAATDGAWRAETTVGITVQDENDNAPTFEKDTYTLLVPPNSALVAVVGRVVAHDADAPGPNSAIKYIIKEASEFFTIDSASGEILSKRQLSYHNATHSARLLENEYTFQVIATDGGRPPLNAECNVRILVTDKNHTPPRFLRQNYVAPIPLGGNDKQQTALVDSFKLIQVIAIDEIDHGLNAEVEYSMEAKDGAQYSGYFDIDHQTGWIFLKQAIDLLPGTVTTYEFTVTATDHGLPPLHAQTTVKLMPSGPNHHPPIFAATNTQIIVPENEPPGSAIIKLAATDADSGINGMLHYSLLGGNHHSAFRIDEENGQIFINKRLDYETEHEYQLIVQAADLGSFPRTAEALLRINLTDVNDNVPYFEHTQYDAYLRENLPSGTKVIQMEAIDLDSPRFGVIEYAIEEEQILQFFDIDKSTGVIISRQPFDYEKYGRYVATVTARNPGSSINNRTKLTIHITGANEFFPQFQQPVFQFSVSESATVGTSVGQVRAVDKDAGLDGNVFYFLVGQSNEQAFQIDKTSGTISVKQSLDRESQNRFVLTVLAKNEGIIVGNDTDEAQVIIQVQDGNDPPVFKQDMYDATVNEDVEPGTVILTVVAVDKDVRPINSQFSYSIIQGNINGTFEVDPNVGTIHTIHELDRETEDQYSLVVAAVDNGSPPQTGTTLVSIKVADVNDNPPVLENLSALGTLRENSPRNTLVAKLQPVDSDLPPNGGPFRFSLSGGEHSSLFSIEEETGNIRALESVDREVTPELYLLVDISDAGTPPLVATYEVTVQVLDENDNPSEPRILTIIVQTLDGDFAGGQIAPVRPKDPDTSGDYSCKIKEGPTKIFTMEENCMLSTGRLVNVDSYNLTVIGTDGKHDSVTSQVYMTFDKFDNQAKDQSIVIHFKEMLHGENLAKVFRLINFHNSASGIIQILSIRTNKDNTEFFVVMRDRNGKYMLPDETSISLRSELQSVLTGILKPETVVTVGFNVCLNGACLNGATCSAAIDITPSETVIVEAGDIVFNSPLFQQTAKCSCPQNYQGDSCEFKTNPCDPNPCEAGGQCVPEGTAFNCLCPQHRSGPLCEIEKSNSCDRNPCQNGGTCRESSTGSEGDFFCLCRPGFQGNLCQISLDPCQPNPCQNGGECIAKKPNYQCKCPDNFYGTNCERTTFGFGEMSFMTFPALDPNTNDISITFSTTKSDSLLLYNFGRQNGGRSDFIAVELVNGEAVFAFGGARTAITRMTVHKHISNGRWYKITATRNNRVASLSVEDCTESGEFCKQCQTGDEKCFTKDVGDTGTLNFNGNPTYFGGIDDVQHMLSRPDQVSSDDFVGCVKSLTLNGQQMNLRTGFLAAANLLPSCPISGSLCNQHICAGGRCIEVNWRPVCECGISSHGSPLQAENCDKSLQPVSMEANATILFQISKHHQRLRLIKNQGARSRNRRQQQQAVSAQNNIDSEVSFTFRTETADGRLMSSETANSNDYTQIYVHLSRVFYETRRSGFPLISLNSSLDVTSGAWHTVRYVHFHFDKKT
jgi:protocadherin Fat 4